VEDFAGLFGGAGDAFADEVEEAVASEDLGPLPKMGCTRPLALTGCAGEP
jgi:hypothetical protein